MYSRIIQYLIDLVEGTFWTLAGPLLAVGGKICRPLTLLLPPAVHSAFQIGIGLNCGVHSICFESLASIDSGIVVVSCRDCS